MFLNRIKTHWPSINKVIIYLMDAFVCMQNTIYYFEIYRANKWRQWFGETYIHYLSYVSQGHCIAEMQGYKSWLGRVTIALIAKYFSYPIVKLQWYNLIQYVSYKTDLVK